MSIGYSFKSKGAGDSPLSFQGPKHLYMDGYLKGERIFARQMGRLHVNLVTRRVSYEEPRDSLPPKVIPIKMPKDLGKSNSNFRDGVVEKRLMYV